MNPSRQIEDLIVGGRKVVDSHIYPAAMLSEQGVPMKYGSNRQQLDVRAVQALQRLFSRTGQVRGNRRGSVVAI